MAPSHWASQSPTTHPGTAAEAAIDAIPSDLVSLRHASSNLMLHYRARASSVQPSRRDEIHTRYAASMLERILARGAPDLTRERGPDDRTVGCCRDAAVLFLALARQKGIPCRGRVGFASYLQEGWWIDHVIVEVWDEAGSRWRLIDAEMRESFKPKLNGRAVDWLDLQPGDFQTGAQAWIAVRKGGADPSKYVVSPSLEVPVLRGWSYLGHNVVHDLAAMNQKEMLLWDGWGLLTELDGEESGVPAAEASLLDEVSAVLTDPDVEPTALEKLLERDGLRIPNVVTRFDPYGGPPESVDVSRVLERSKI